MADGQKFVRFQMFQTGETTWPKLLAEVAAYATRVGQDRLIGISQSQGAATDATIVVWYWASTPPPPPTVET